MDSEEDFGFVGWTGHFFYRNAVSAATSGASTASAQVLYNYNYEGTATFSYLAPGYVTSSITLSPSDLISCTYFTDGCGKADILFDVTKPTTVRFRVYSVDGGFAGGVFPISDAGMDGVYSTAVNQANTLNVTSVPGASGAVPKPASWAMMILGMGAVGHAVRSGKRRSDAKFDTKIKTITGTASA